MDYLSVKEIAELWGVSIRMVNYYLNTGRIQQCHLVNPPTSYAGRRIA